MAFFQVAECNYMNTFFLYGIPVVFFITETLNGLIISMGCIVSVRGVSVHSFSKRWTYQRFTVGYSPFHISGKPNKSAAMDLKTNPLLARTGSLRTNLRSSPGVSKADSSSSSPLTKLSSALTLTSCHLDSRVNCQNVRPYRLFCHLQFVECV